MAILRKVDCIRLYVPDLEAGLPFYRDRPGHELIWRTETAAGLRLPESEAELVLQAEDQSQEVDLLLDSADEAAKQIGRCVVLEDPWGNPLVLLDASRGFLATDSEGNVIGNLPS